MADYRAQEVRNQTVFRQMNEWTRGGSEGSVATARRLYLCECSDRHCTDPISLTLAEYERVRSEATRFAIAPDHENPEIDHVVTEGERFTTVGKFSGEAVRLARATDPRR